MISKKNVLVIGGAGYIGGETVDNLIASGHNVTVYDLLIYESRFLKPVKFVHGDIRDIDKIIYLSKNFDTIVLLAALVGDPACSVDLTLTESINYISIKNICERLDKSKHVIFMSTCSVYGAQDGILDEDSPTNPLSSYASTKLAAEKYVNLLNGTIFRLGTVFGLGDNYSRLRMDLVVNVLTMKAFFEKKININGGDQWRPIISVVDIAGYITEAVDREIRGTYILSHENVIIRELGLRIAKLIPNTEIRYVEIPFQDARNYRVSNKRVLEYFFYKSKVSVEDEVKRMLKLFEDKRIDNPNDIVYHNGLYIKNVSSKLNKYEYD